MAERREVDADLVGAPGVEVTAQECMRAPLFDHLVPRARKPPAFDHRHALAILRMAADRALQLSRSRLDLSTHDREVSAAEGPIAELRAQVAVAGVVARDDDQT